MRPIVFSLSCLAFVLLRCGPALAAGHMAPGLWDMSVQSDALKAIPAIPPEQLDKLRALGIKIPDISNGATKTQVCITPEMASADLAPAAGARKMGCTAENSRFDGNRFSADVTCDNKRIQGSGKVSGTFASDRDFTSSFQFKGVVRGLPVDQNGTATGKWVGPDCGSVKPLRMPPAKP